MKRKNLQSAVAALGMAGLLVVGSITPVYAEDSMPQGPSLIQRIMERFGLNKTEVEETIEEHRSYMQTQRKNQMTSRLEEAVQNGNLTDEQKNLLIQKMSEWQDERGSEKGTYHCQT